MYQGLAEESAGSESKVSRALMAAVIIMGVMIVVGIIVLVWVVIARAVDHNPASVAGASVNETVATTPTRLALPLASGEHIHGVVARGDGTLAVTLESPSAARVLLWSPERGRVIAEVDFRAPSRP